MYDAEFAFEPLPTLGVVQLINVARASVNLGDVADVQLMNVKDV